MPNLHVDTELCQGHGRCFVGSPELFEDDDDGFPVVLHPAVPDALVESARRAVVGCPESAITLSD